MRSELPFVRDIETEIGSERKEMDRQIETEVEDALATCSHRRVLRVRAAQS